MQTRLHPRTNAAFTLMEMMVAVAILAIMMLIFGTVISQTQEAVNAAHDLILAEREASAVSGVIRQDLRAISRVYLRVLNGEQIAFTVAGPHESILARTEGNVHAAGIPADSNNLVDAVDQGWSTNYYQGGLVRFNDLVTSGTLGQVTADTGTDADIDKSWNTGMWTGATARIMSGDYTGLTRMVISNSDSSLPIRDSSPPDNQTPRTFQVYPDWLTPGGGPSDKQEIDTTDLLVYLKFDDPGNPLRNYAHMPAEPNWNGATAVNGDIGLVADQNFDGAPGSAAVPGTALGAHSQLNNFNSVTANGAITVSCFVWLTNTECSHYTGYVNRTFDLQGNSGRGANEQMIYTSAHGWSAPRHLVKPHARDWVDYGSVNTAALESEVSGRYHHYVARIKTGELTTLWIDTAPTGDPLPKYSSSNPPADGFNMTPPGNANIPGWYHSTSLSRDGWAAGLVDELAVWGRALSPEEIQKLASKNWVPKLTGTDGSLSGPTSGDTYALFFPPYPISSNNSRDLTVTTDWTGPVPGGQPYTAYFASNSALIDYGRISSSGSPGNALWRRIYLLVPEADATKHNSNPANADDVLAQTPNSIEDTTFQARCLPQPAITLPPTSTKDWFSYLIGNCTDLQIAVYDPATSDWLINWSSEGKDPEEWPSAVRVRFTLRGQTYEVISNIN